ncbi:MAG: transporter [Elusimicrobia bacterium]|nr:transporter [Elusimicrobiota bacterium]
MRKYLFAVLLPALFCARAAAFSPLIGEDARFLGEDGRQMQGWLDYGVSREGADRYSTGAFAELVYGLFEKLELKVTVPWHGWTSRGISESGLGDVMLEGKFGCACRAGWDLALKPGFSLPAGNEAKSLGAGKGGAWLYGIAERSFGEWRLTLNGGYMYNRNSIDERESIFSGSGAAALRLGRDLAATAMLSAATNMDKSRSSHPLNAMLGLVWSPYRTLDVNFGTRFGLNNGADDYGLVGGLALRI